MRDYQAAPNLLDNKVILVTGAGDGIGKAVALAYAQHGATVLLLGRNEDKLEAVYDEIEKNNSPKPAILPLDLAQATAEDYQKLAEIIETEFGYLDGLLHNASILGDLTLLEQYSEQTWNSVIQVNLNAPFLMTKPLLPLMKKRANASILFTSSSVGRIGRAYWGAYSVSKFGIEGLMQILSQELENTTSIRVNSINPGATRTKMRAEAYPAEDPITLTTPEDLIPVYLYLMGEDSIGINGQALDAQIKKTKS